MLRLFSTILIVVGLAASLCAFFIEIAFKSFLPLTSIVASVLLIYSTIEIYGLRTKRRLMSPLFEILVVTFATIVLCLSVLGEAPMKRRSVDTTVRPDLRYSPTPAP